jgi:hypothetical protein
MAAQHEAATEAKPANPNRKQRREQQRKIWTDHSAAGRGTPPCGRYRRRQRNHDRKGTSSRLC